MNALRVLGVKSLVFLIVWALIGCASPSGNQAPAGQGAAPAGETGTQSAEQGAKDEPPVKIGLMAPLTGPVSAYGQAMAEAARIAVDEINAAGGILGRQVDLVVLDDGSETEKGVTAARQLIEQEKVDAMFGTQRSGVALAVLEVAADHQMPYIISGAADTSILEKIASDATRYKYIFRTSPDAGDLAASIWPFVTETVKAKTYYYVAEDTAWAKTMHRFLQEMAQRDGLTEAGVAWLDPKATEFTSTVLDIKQKQPDVIISGLIAGVPYFYKQYVDLQGPAPVINMTVDMAMLKSLGDRAENIVSNTLSPALPLTAKTLPYIEKYRQRTGSEPIAYHDVRTYDAIHIYAEAVNKAATLDKDKLVEALLGQTFEGAGGNYQFDPQTHHPKWGEGYLVAVIYQWQQGKQVVLWPEQYRQGDFKWGTPQ